VPNSKDSSLDPQTLALIVASLDMVGAEDSDILRFTDLLDKNVDNFTKEELILIQGIFEAKKNSQRTSDL